MSSNYITKSKYVDFCKCPRLYYLNQFHKELAINDEFRKHLAINGIKVGELARNYFDNSFVIKKNNNEKMRDDTLEAIKSGEKIICEASFIYNDLFCAVDILKINENNDIEIYEVKSTTGIDKFQICDASFQYYVLSKLGYNISKIRLLILNNEYVFNDSIDLKKYFKEVEFKLKTNVEENIEKIRKINEEGELLACKECQKSYTEKCPYFNYCYRDISDLNVFNIAGLTNKYEYFNDGIITYEDFYNHYQDIINKRKFVKKKETKSLKKAYNQVSRYVNKCGLNFNDEVVESFLASLKYPLYYLDFETYKDIIPFINGTKTNFERVYQYSIHIQKSKYSNCSHKEYIQESKYDNLEEVAIKLINDLGDDGSIIVYHKSMESNRIKELAILVKKYEKSLNKICDRIVDLEDLFVNRDIYDDSMKGRSTIKLVLPAVVPEYKNAYEKLPTVHNGTQAITGYEKLIDKKYIKHDELKKDMLAYCELDTLAMVKILEKINNKIDNDKKMNKN